MASLDLNVYIYANEFNDILFVWKYYFIMWIIFWIYSFFPSFDWEDETWHPDMEMQPVSLALFR